MSDRDWSYVKQLARERGTTLKAAGVRRSQRLGYAIDSILAVTEEFS